MAGETSDDHSGQKEMRKFEMVLAVLDPDTYETRIVFKFPGKPDVTLIRALSRRVK